MSKYYSTAEHVLLYTVHVHPDTRPPLSMLRRPTAMNPWLKIAGKACLFPASQGGVLSPSFDVDGPHTVVFTKYSVCKHLNRGVSSRDVSALLRLITEFIHRPA